MQILALTRYEGRLHNRIRNIPMVYSLLTFRLHYYGRTKINTAASPTGSQTGEQFIIGFNYRPVEDYVFKMEYQFNHGQFNQTSSDGFLTSIAWLF